MTGLGQNVLNRWARMTHKRGFAVGIPFREVIVDGDDEHRKARVYKRTDVEQFIREQLEGEVQS